MFKKKPKFYTLDKIKKKDAIYNVIIGERSNGKTFAVLKEGVEKFLAGAGQLAIIRRWKEDITGKRASGIFNAINESGTVKKLSKGVYDGVAYYNGRFFLCTYDDAGKPVYNDSDCLGYLFALSDTEHNKSVSYPKITTIMFDEFLTKHLYLNDEFVLFMNTVSTIVRQRTDVVIYMLGNTVNKYSPYFAEMGLNHIDKMQQGTIDVYKYGESGLTVAVEYCASMQESKANNFYFAFNNPKLEMITGGAWELNIYPHLPAKYKPKDIQFTYFIEFNDGIYQCEIILQGDITYTYIHLKTTPIKDSENDMIYSFDYVPRMNYSRNIFKPQNKLQQRILWYYNTDRIFYQNNEVGDAISNYLKVCKRG